MWALRHQVQHEAFLAGEALPFGGTGTFYRFADEFEKALAQRGEQAKEAAIRRGEYRLASHKIWRDRRVP